MDGREKLEPRRIFRGKKVRARLCFKAMRIQKSR